LPAEASKKVEISQTSSALAFPSCQMQLVSLSVTKLNRGAQFHAAKAKKQSAKDQRQNAGTSGTDCPIVSQSHYFISEKAFQKC